MQDAEHHGDRWFKEAVEQGHLRDTVELLKRAVAKAGIPLGSTGQFPLGTLTPDDEGELRLAVTAKGVVATPTAAQNPEMASCSTPR